MNRGDWRGPIFLDEADRRRFVETLGEACAKTGWQVRAYVDPERLGMGARGHLNHLLYRRRKAGGE